MYIHKKGYSVIASIVTIVVLFFVLLNFVFQFTIRAIPVGLSVIGIIIIIWSVSFFRVPTNRKITMMDNAVVSSADGEIVAIEDVEEKEYFHDKRIQISVFMSAYDVLQEEILEIFDAIFDGDIYNARLEIYDSIAVLLRLDKVLQEKQRNLYFQKNDIPILPKCTTEI